VGYVLDQLHEVARDSTYREGARRCFDLVKRHVRTEGGEVFWNADNDVLGGSAGTGLGLLYAARRLDDAEALALAVRVGDTLVGRALRDSTGWTWRRREGSEVILPNFSHGGAGVGYFLATLHGATGRERFLEAALQAAAYLQAIARTDDETVFLVPYGWPNPEWEGLYDVGWAHGPVGTARIFQQVAYLTGDPQWTETVDWCAAGCRAGGVPGPPNPGFGDEPFKDDRRFGSASVAAFYLRLFQTSGGDTNLEAARTLVEHLVARGTRDAQGLRWTRPAYAFMDRAGEPSTYTGYFYGAAGMGLLLLQLDAETTGREYPVAFPDDPFGLVSEF
jgi:lantibiotic modifying enzyme